MPESEVLKKEVIIPVAVGVLATIITSVGMGFFALPAYYARSDERIIGLREKYEENKRRTEVLESKLKDSQDRTSEIMREVSAFRDAINNNSAFSSTLGEKIFTLDQSLKEIKTIDPIADQCADIMRQIINPTPTETMYRSRSEENLTALYERFDCPRR